jgi:hypothetical protein
MDYTATDPSSYFGANPVIAIDKVTNGADGLDIPVGSAITWTYTVTNAGNVALANVMVTDDQGVVPAYVSGDADLDNLLDLTETWIFEANGTAVAGPYSNLGTATGSFTDDFGSTGTATDTDPSSYTGTQDVCYEGLTPGFWKNAQNWRKVDLDDDCLDWLGQFADANYDGKAGISFTDIMNTVTFAEAFGVGDFSYRQSGQTLVVDADISLVQALSLGGGVQSMFRQATAALLNSCTEEHQGDEFNFFLDTDQVIELVQDVYDLPLAQRRAGAVDLGPDLALLNELGTEGGDGYVCPDPDYLASLFPSLFPEMVVA